MIGLDQNTLKQYQTWLKNQNLSSTSVKRKFSSVRKFCSWAKDKKLIKNDPFQLTPDVKKSSTPVVGKLIPERKSQPQLGKYLTASVIIILFIILGFLGHKYLLKREKPSVRIAEQQVTAGPQINRYFSFQGRLVDSSGNPVTTPVKTQFVLYSHQIEKETAELWEETKTVIPDETGSFKTTLGNIIPLPNSIFTDYYEVWLGITIENDEEMRPRTQIPTVGYAAKAKTLEGFPPSASPSANQIPVLTPEGNLVLMAPSPMIYSTSGTFGIKGQAVTITTDTGTNGDIDLAPDGTGVLNINLGGSTGNQMRITDANISSGTLVSAYAGNDNTTYNLLSLSHGSTETEVFTVSATGDVFISGTTTIEQGLKVDTDTLFVDAVNKRVGIRTATPTQALDVRGNISLNQYIYHNQDEDTFFNFEEDSIKIEAGGLGFLHFLETSASDTLIGNYNNQIINFRWDGDTNDGLFFIDASQEMVGIGTTAPGQKLDVKGSTQVGGDLRVDRQLRLGRYTTNPTAIGEASIIYNTSDDKLYYYNGSSWVEIIIAASRYWQRNSGAVSPTNITDDVLVGATSTASALLKLPGLTNQDAWFNLGTGNVGIGTTAPSAKTHLVQTGATNAFRVDDEASDTTPFVINASGNVGIGTGGPSYALDVNGTIRTGYPGTDGQFRIYSEQGGTDYEVVLQPGTMTQNTTYTLPVNDGDASQVLSSDGSGVLSWINVSGGAGALWTDGGTYLRPTSYGRSVRIYDSGESDYLDIAHDGTDANITTNVDTTDINFLDSVTFGDGGTTDYAYFSTTGDLTFYGNADTITGPSGGALTVTAGASQALTLTSNGAATWSSSTGALIISGDDGLTLTAANTAGVTINSTAGTLLLNATGQTVDVDGTTLDVDVGTVNIDGSTAVNLGTTTDVPFDIDTSTLDVDSSGNITLDTSGTATITLTTAGGNLTLNTATGNNNIVLNAGTGTIDLEGIVDIDESNATALTVGDGANDTLVVDTASDDVTVNLGDNNAVALDIQQGTTDYLLISTATGLESITLGNATDNPAINLAAGSSEIDLTTTGAVDLNSGAGTWDASTLSLDSTDTTNLTMSANDAGNKTLMIAATNAGAGNALINLSADTLDLNATTIDLSTQTVDVTLSNNIDALNFDSNTLSIDASNDRVGIGTTGPSSLLDVTKTAIGATQSDAYGLSLVNTTAAALDTQQYSPPLRWRGFGWETTGGTSQSVDFRAFVRPIQGTSTTGGLDFQSSINGAAYSDLVTILSGGNVGIGTTGPAELLHLRRASSTGTGIRLDSADGDIVTDDILGYIDFRSSVDHYGLKARIEAVAEGTFTGTDSYTGLAFYTNKADGSVAEKMRINYDGNVGIGTTAPSNKLDVIGDVGIDNQGDIRLYEGDAGGSNYTGFQSPSALAADVLYTLPSADGSASYVLITNGSGTLSWSSVGAASIADDSLDFDKFQDIMDLDADLTLNQAAYTWTQNFTGTTTTGLTYNADSLTTGTAIEVSTDALTSGKGLYLSSTSTGMTGDLTNITLSGSNAANTGSLLSLTNSGILNTNTTFYLKHYATGTNNLAMRVDDVASDTTPFVIDGGGNVGIGTTGPDSKLEVLSSDQIIARFESPDELVAEIAVLNDDDYVYFGSGVSNAYMGGTSGVSALNLNVDIAGGHVGIGKVSPSAKLDVNYDETTTIAGSYYGIRSDVDSTGIFTTGTTHIYGTYGDAATTGVSTGGTVNTYGGYFTAVGEGTGAATTNAYGLYVNGATGADNNYSAVFMNGNVGIGTTTPSNKLDVIGDVGIDNQGDIRLYEGDAGGSNYTGFQSPSVLGTDVLYTLPAADATTTNQVLSSNAAGILSWIDVSAGSGVLWTDGGTFLRPTSYDRSVRVYNSGATDYIDISHDGDDAILGFANTTALNINIGTIDLSAQTVDFTLSNNIDALNFDSNTLSIDASNDRVGIGTTGPSVALDIFRGNPSTSAAIRVGAWTHDSYYGEIAYDANSPYNLDFKNNRTDGTIRFMQGANVPMYIQATSGNVGIGTTVPGAKLEVEVADADNTGGIFIDFNEVGNYNALQVDSESTTYAAIQSYGKYTLRLNPDISGGYGIEVTRNLAEAGSNPLVNFIDDHTSNTQTTLRVQQDGTGDILNLFDGTTEVFTVLNGGNVGIGTTNPSSLLHLASTSTSTSFTGFNLDWSPGSSTTATGDLFSINIGANGNAANLLNVKDNGSSLFSVSETQITSALPHQFTSSGDVSLAYDLIFTNQTASYIKSYAPLYMEAGESFESNDLTLSTYNAGDIVFDAGDASGDTGTIKFYDAYVKGATDTTPIAFADGSDDINSYRTNYTDETIIGSLVEVYGMASGSSGGIWVDSTPGAGAGIIYPNYATDDLAIGGTSLAAPFSVDESLNTVRIGEGSGSNAILNMYASDGDTGSITYNTNDAWAFENGNVGIGTTGPIRPLHVYSDSTGWIFTTERSGNNPSLIQAKNSVGSTLLGFEGSAAGATVIGTLANASFVANQGAYPLQFGTNNNIRMTIDSDGNVGIGTTGPTQRLWVAGGGAEFSSSLSVNEEATTNQYGARALTASLCTSTSGWGTWTGGTGCAVAADSTYSFEGQTTTVKVTMGTSTCYVDPNPSPAVTTSTTYSTTFIMRNSAGTQPSGITFTFDNETCTPTWEAYGNSWYRGTCTKTTDATPSNSWDGFYMSSGDYIWVARGQIEQKSAPTAFTAYIRTSPSVNASAPLEVNTTSDSYFYGGNVGIGTTSPATKLHARDSAATNVEIARFDSYGNSGSIQGKTYIGLHHWTSGTYPSARIGVEEDGVVSYDSSLVFQTRNSGADVVPTTKVVIDKSGNVGIGTTAPGASLEVNKNQNGLTAIYALNANTGSSARTAFAFGEAVTGGTYGYIGYQNSNYSPAGGSEFYAPSSLVLEADSAASGGLRLGSFHTSGYISFFTAGTATANERMRIDDTGNVGIGTTDPQARLEVVGVGDTDPGSSAVLPAIKATAGNTPACFLAGTKIAQPEGTKKIENLKVGDKIRSYSLEARKVTESAVTEIYKARSDHYYLINNKIKVTGEHPFYVAGKWVKVKDLKEGMALFDGHLEIPIESLKRIDEQVEVYNLQVAGYHNYFANGVLVHNKTPRTYAIYAVAGSGTSSYAGYFGGNVGIGTTAPGAGLEIDTSGSVSGFKIENGDASDTWFNYQNASTNYIRGTTTYVDTTLDMNNHGIVDINWGASDDGSGSGLDADLLDGQNLTTAATGNTVMGRDANGDTWVRYLNSSYVNMSHGVSGATADTIFYSSTDNYIRKNNATGMRASLGLIAGGAGDIWVEKAGDTMSGPLVMNSTYIDIDRDAAADSGIQWYSNAYNAWAEYMAPTGAGMGPRGTLTAPSGTYVTSWAQRSYIENGGGYGWTFESAANTTTPAVKFEIRASDGLFHSYGAGVIDGNLTVSGRSYQRSIHVTQNADRDVVNYSVITSTPNLHLDSKDGQGIYLNWYGGENGTYFGNGASGQVGRMDGSGNLSMSGNLTVGGTIDTGQWDLANDYLYEDGEEVIRTNDEWLRLNQANAFTNGTYTPYLIRADGGFNVDGGTAIDAANRYHYSTNTSTNKWGAVNGSGFGLDALNSGDWDLLIYESQTYTSNLKLGYSGSATLNTYDTNESLTINANGTGNILMMTSGTGNVGIGTDSFHATVDGLQIVGSTTNYILDVGTATTYGGWYVNDVSNYMGIGTRTNDEFELLVNGQSRLRIDTSGNIGIGDASPDAKLDVEGTIYATGYGRDAHSEGHLVGSYNSVGANSDKSNPIYTIGSSYNPSDSALGSMYGIGYSHDNFWYDTLGVGKSDAGWGMYVAADGDIRATISGSNGDIWTTGEIYSAGAGNNYFAGNIGIGVTGPTYHLQVESSANNQFQVTGKGTGYGGTLLANIYSERNVTGTGALLQVGSAYAPNTLYVQDSGKVGIGTTNPIARFTSAPASANPANGIDTFGLTTTGTYGGGIGLQDGTGDFGIWVDTTGTAARFGFGTSLGALSTKLSILSSGNVGIGATVPGQKLEVANGNIEITSNYSLILKTDDVNAHVKYHPDNISEITNYVENGRVGLGVKPTAVGNQAWFVWNAKNSTTLLSQDGAGNLDILGGYSDYAETIRIRGPEVNQGDLVIIHPSENETGSISTQPYSPKLLGIISTKPGMLLSNKKDKGVYTSLGTQGTSLDFRDNAPLALIGRVPTKVSSFNGTISSGDPITSSDLPGIGMKATKAGPTVGKALESTNHWNETNCPAVSSLASIVWPADDGTNPAKPCFRLPDGTHVGKIMVFVNVGWYDPDVYLTSTGDVVTNNPNGGYEGLLADGSLESQKSKVKSQIYKVKDKAGETVERLANFAEIAVGKIKAGLVDTEYLVAEKGIVSPVVVTDEVRFMNNDLRFTNGVGETVASLDQQGKATFGDLVVNQNATIAGELIAHKSSIENLKSNEASIENLTSEEITTSTISARIAKLNKVYADEILAKKIKAEEIEGLKATISDLVAKEMENETGGQGDNETNNYYYQSSTPEQSSPATSNQQPATSDLSDLVDASISATLLATGNWQLDADNYLALSSFDADSGVFNEYLAVLGQATITNLSVTNGMVVNNSMYITENSIGTVEKLFIQPSGLGGIDILAGKFVIDESGDVHIKGNVYIAGEVYTEGLETRRATVSGSLFASLIKPLNKDLVIQLNQQPNNTSEAGKLRIEDANNNLVASIDASGSAKFNKLLIASAEATPSGSGFSQIINPEVKTNASAGKATLKANTTEIKISSPHLTADSLVYITPQSDTENKVLYVKSKSTNNQQPTTNNYFVVAMNKPITKDIIFNWWIIN